MVLMALGVCPHIPQTYSFVLKSKKDLLVLMALGAYLSNPQIWAYISLIYDHHVYDDNKVLIGILEPIPPNHGFVIYVTFFLALSKLYSSNL